MIFSALLLLAHSAKLHIKRFWCGGKASIHCYVGDVLCYIGGVYRQGLVTPPDQGQRPQKTNDRTQQAQTCFKLVLSNTTHNIWYLLFALPDPRCRCGQNMLFYKFYKKMQKTLFLTSQARHCYIYIEILKGSLRNSIGE